MMDGAATKGLGRVSGLRLSIVARLALLVLAVGLPLSGIVAWSVHAQFGGQVDAAHQHAIGITNAMATRAEISVDRTRAVLAEIAKRPHVQAMDRSRCDPFVVELRKFQPQYANISTFNLQWEFVCSASLDNSTGVVVSLYPELYERMKAADDMVLSGPVRGQLTGRLVVIAAYPVKDAANRLIGAVTAPIDLLAFSPAVAGASQPVNLRTRILDGAGWIVASTPDTERVGQRVESAAATALAGKRGTWIEIGPDGVERVFAATPVSRTDWVASAGLPAEALFAELRRERNRILATLLLVFVLSAGFVFMAARRISRPLRELRRDAEALDKGNLAHRSRVATRDEIGELATAFNEMAQSLESQAAASAVAEKRILHLNRVYAMLSGINAAIVRIRERGELFAEVCRIAVSEGGFSFASVIDLDASGVGSIAAASELDHSQLQRVLDHHNGDPLHSGTVIALVLQTGKPVISNDVATDPRFPNRSALTAQGSYGLALLPILAGTRVAGALLLRTAEPGKFDAEEERLLLDLVANLSFALESLGKQDRLDYLAYHDALTGLANRRLFLDRVAQHLRAAAVGGHRLAVFMIDLERFKNINDTFGHAAGDALLKQVADWLAAGAGNVNLVARIGADHFAVVSPVIRRGREVGGLLEKKLGDFLEHTFAVGEAQFRISFKVGVAQYPDDGADADALFRNAEAALKSAKAAGDRYLFYNRKMTAAVAAQLTLENQLRQALQNEEFVLHYQPKVNLASGLMTGAEALIRWNDPRTGLVPPGRFIPVLEETGMIHEVGRWALRRASADFLRWRAAGLGAVRIAVNVSPLQLRNLGFIAEIEQVIGIDPQAAAGLELEITESLIMADVQLSIATLTAIRALGVTIAIDDFGTGFSSLAYLARLPVDTLKIDRAFVVAMTVDQQGLALVSTIINLAHSLKRKVVAEGVETEEQRRLLHLLSCDEMQGYLFSKAVPAEEFEARFLAAANQGET